MVVMKCNYAKLKYSERLWKLIAPMCCGRKEAILC